MIVRVLQRLLALTAAIWHNENNSQPVMREPPFADVSPVVNCHLHFDHCGGNPPMGGTPILVQAVELATARRGSYTIDELFDFPGATYEEIDGEAEVWPGVWIVPTPGHTDGHQSLVVQQSDGTAVLSGQADDIASQFASDRSRRYPTTV